MDRSSDDEFFDAPLLGPLDRDQPDSSHVHISVVTPDIPDDGTQQQRTAADALRALTGQTTASSEGIAIPAVSHSNLQSSTGTTITASETPATSEYTNRDQPAQTLQTAVDADHRDIPITAPEAQISAGNIPQSPRFVPTSAPETYITSQNIHRFNPSVPESFQFVPIFRPTVLTSLQNVPISHPDAIIPHPNIPFIQTYIPTAGSSFFSPPYCSPKIPVSHVFAIPSSPYVPRASQNTQHIMHVPQDDNCGTETVMGRHVPSSPFQPPHRQETNVIGPYINSPSSDHLRRTSGQSPTSYTRFLHPVENAHQLQMPADFRTPAGTYGSTPQSAHVYRTSQSLERSPRNIERSPYGSQMERVSETPQATAEIRRGSQISEGAREQALVSSMPRASSSIERTPKTTTFIVRPWSDSVSVTISGMGARNRDRTKRKSHQQRVSLVSPESTSGSVNRPQNLLTEEMPDPRTTNPSPQRLSIPRISSDSDVRYMTYATTSSSAMSRQEHTGRSPSSMSRIESGAMGAEADSRIEFEQSVDHLSYIFSHSSTVAGNVAEDTPDCMVLLSPTHQKISRHNTPINESTQTYTPKRSRHPSSYSVSPTQLSPQQDLPSPQHQQQLLPRQSQQKMDQIARVNEKKLAMRKRQASRPLLLSPSLRSMLECSDDDDELMAGGPSIHVMAPSETANQHRSRSVVTTFTGRDTTFKESKLLRPSGASNLPTSIMKQYPASKPETLKPEEAPLDLRMIEKEELRKSSSFVPSKPELGNQRYHQQQHLPPSNYFTIGSGENRISTSSAPRRTFTDEKGTQLYYLRQQQSVSPTLALLEAGAVRKISSSQAPGTSTGEQSSQHYFRQQQQNPSPTFTLLEAGKARRSSSSSWAPGTSTYEQSSPSRRQQQKNTPLKSSTKANPGKARRKASTGQRLLALNEQENERYKILFSNAALSDQNLAETLMVIIHRHWKSEKTAELHRSRPAVAPDVPTSLGDTSVSDSPQKQVLYLPPAPFVSEHSASTSLPEMPSTSGHRASASKDSALPSFSATFGPGPSTSGFSAPVPQPDTAPSGLGQPKSPASQMSLPALVTYDNSRASKFLEFMEQSWKKGTDVDTALIVGDKWFKVHSVVMESVCQGGFKEHFKFEIYRTEVAGLDKLDIDWAKPEVVELVLEYAYKGILTLRMSIASDLLRLGHYLRIPFVRDETERFLVSHLNVDNVCELLNLAMDLDARYLLMKALMIFTTQPREVMKTSGFICMNPYNLSRLFRQDFLVLVENEIILTRIEREELLLRMALSYLTGQLSGTKYQYMDSARVLGSIRPVSLPSAEIVKSIMDEYPESKSYPVVDTFLQLVREDIHATNPYLSPYWARPRVPAVSTFIHRDKHRYAERADTDPDNLDVEDPAMRLRTINIFVRELGDKSVIGYIASTYHRRDLNDHFAIKQSIKPDLKKMKAYTVPLLLDEGIVKVTVSSDAERVYGISFGTSHGRLWGPFGGEGGHTVTELAPTAEEITGSEERRKARAGLTHSDKVHNLEASLYTLCYNLSPDQSSVVNLTFRWICLD